MYIIFRKNHALCISNKKYKDSFQKSNIKSSSVIPLNLHYSPSPNITLSFQKLIIQKHITSRNHDETSKSIISIPLHQLPITLTSPSLSPSNPSSSNHPLSLHFSFSPFLLPFIPQLQSHLISTFSPVFISNSPNRLFLSISISFRSKNL